MYYQNIDGLTAEKWETIKTKAESENFKHNMILMSETFRRPSTTGNFKLNIEGWTCWEFISGQFCSGRVFVATRDDLEVSQVRIKTSIEQLLVTTTIQNQEFDFLVLYLPPSSPAMRFQSHCDLVAQKLLENPKLRLVSIGDYNVRVSNFVSNGAINPAKNSSNATNRGGLILSMFYGMLGYKQIIPHHPDKKQYTLDLCWMPSWMPYTCTTVQPLVQCDSEDLVSGDILNHLAVNIIIPVKKEDEHVSSPMQNNKL